jgi:hypothetical protein
MKIVACFKRQCGLRMVCTVCTAPCCDSSRFTHVASVWRKRARAILGFSCQGVRSLLRHCESTGRANARPMTGSAKQPTPLLGDKWIASAFALRRCGGLEACGACAASGEGSSLRSSQCRCEGTRSRSRGAFSSGRCQFVVPLPQEGAGKAGRWVHPQPHVQQKRTRVSHHRYSQDIPALVLRSTSCSPR